jgi:hypothetical protein
MPGSQRGQRAAKEGHRSRLGDPLVAVLGIHLAGAEKGSRPVVEEERRIVDPEEEEERHNRLVVPEGVGPTEIYVSERL